MADIANSTLSCMRSFSRLIAALATGEQEHRESMPPEKIEIEHGRFKIWSGNLRALQSDRSSLDFRLRESFVMQTNVMKLLMKLDQILQKSLEFDLTLILGIQVANGSRLPLEKLPKPEYLSDDSSEDESEIENEERLIATELSQQMLTVMDILADLYKLSFRIRSVVTRTKSLKPTLYKEIDEETGVDKFEKYAHYDHNNVLESFKQLRKNATEQTSKIISESSKGELEGMYLVERLAITITKRRRALCYWQRHAKKLLDAPDVLKGDNEAVPALPKGATAHLNAGQLRQRLQSVPASSMMYQSPLSDTEATRYDPKLDDFLDMQSAISYASKAFDVHGNMVNLPPAPVAASKGSEFVCPYCGIVCPSSHGKNRAWRAHVLQDLQPYICTYPECSDEFQMHSNRRLWLEHERLVHRRIWQCFYHVNAVFPSSAELQDHLQSEHSFTKAQIETLLDICESSVKDIRTKCPICLEKGPFERGLDNHLSSHLEIFATFSIPRGIFSGDESESRANSDSEKVQGLRSDNLTESSSLGFQSPPASTTSYTNKDLKTFSIPRGIFSSDESESRADSDSKKVQGIRSNISTESFSLQAASFEGHEEVVKLLAHGGADVNAQGGEYGNALQAASYGGHEEVVKLLLQEGADVNAQGGYSGNALQAASDGGHEEVVKLLVHWGADVNAQGGHYGNALQAASFEGHEEVVKLLVHKGADVDAQGGEYGNALTAASSNGHEEVVKLLVHEGADVNAQGGEYGNALTAASFKGHEEVVKLLLQEGADVNAHGGFYGNALQAASSKGHEEVVKLLFHKGADVNAQGGKYGNALTAASYKGREKVVKLLLHEGADVNAQGGEYGNALQAASLNGHEEVVKLLVHWGADVNAQGGQYGNALTAASYKGREKVVKLLLHEGADVNAQGGEYGNALQAASSNGHEEVVKLLVHEGADVNAQGGRCGNALTAASFEGHEEVVKLLLPEGADVNAHSKFFYGNALQAASYGGHEEVVKLLLHEGVDINAQGGKFGNALQAASYGGHEEVVKLLLHEGVDINAQGGKFGNALQAASYGGREEVVKLLLHEGVDINAQGGKFGNALQAASYGGHEMVIQLLAKHDAKSVAL